MPTGGFGFGLTRDLPGRSGGSFPFGTLTRRFTPGASWSGTPETVTETDASGEALTIETLSVSLNNGAWACTLGNGITLLTFAHLDGGAGTDTKRIHLWARSPYTGEWTDVSADLRAAVADLDGGVLTPVLAADPSTSAEEFVIAAVTTGTTDAGRVFPEDIVVARLRLTADKHYESFGVDKVSSVTGYGTYGGYEAPGQPSVAVSPDGYAVVTFVATPSSDATAPARVLLAWEDTRNDRWAGGEVVFEDPSRAGAFPSVAAGDEAIVVAWTDEETDAAGRPLGRTVRTRSYPRREVTDTHAGGPYQEVSPNGAVDATVAGSDAGGEDAWDACVVWAEAEGFVVGFQEKSGRAAAPICATSLDDGATWATPETLEGSAYADNYFVSLAAGDGRVLAAWESRQYSSDGVVAAEAEGFVTGWDGSDAPFDGGTELDPLDRDGRDFAVLPCATAMSGWGIGFAWVVHDEASARITGNRGRTSDVAIRFVNLRWT